MTTQTAEQDVEAARAYLRDRREAARTYLQARGIDRADVNCSHRYEQCQHVPPPPHIVEVFCVRDVPAVFTWRRTESDYAMTDRAIVDGG